MEAEDGEGGEAWGDPGVPGERERDLELDIDSVPGLRFVVVSGLVLVLEDDLPPGTCE